MQMVSRLDGKFGILGLCAVLLAGMASGFAWMTQNSPATINGQPISMIYVEAFFALFLTGGYMAMEGFKRQFSPEMNPLSDIEPIAAPEKAEEKETPMGMFNEVKADGSNPTG